MLSLLLHSGHGGETDRHEAMGPTRGGSNSSCGPFTCKHREEAARWDQGASRGSRCGLRGSRGPWSFPSGPLLAQRPLGLAASTGKPEGRAGMREAATVMTECVGSGSQRLKSCDHNSKDCPSQSMEINKSVYSLLLKLLTKPEKMIKNFKYFTSQYVLPFH